MHKLVGAKLMMCALGSLSVSALLIGVATIPAV